MGSRDRRKFLSPAEKVGLASLALAVPLFLLQPASAIIPLSAFLLLCMGAPFYPRSSFFLPVISRAREKTDGITLTFDDGPSPASTPIILDLLDRYSLQATFFVVGEKAAAHPELIQSILAGGHSIGNHSLKHDYFLMLRSGENLQTDIRETQNILKKSGVIPLVFRPPTGISGPRLARVLAEENLLAVTYSCQAYDRGNRNVRHLAAKILQRLRPGDIIMLHDLPPQQKSMTDYWQQELDTLFSSLKSDHQVVPLETLIQEPVMKKTPEK